MGWLNWWSQRKQLYISGSSTSAVTNYQMRITVNYGSGTDSAGNIYFKSQVRSDFGDVRFTSSDGVTPLYYWIESSTSGSSAVIWVNVASIPTGSSFIYVYYNNPNETSLSNGDGTFIFMDDFGSTSYTNKWQLRSSTGYSTITEGSGNLTMTCTGTGGGGSAEGASISSYISPNPINVGNGIEIHVKIVSASASSNWNRYSIDFGTGTRTENYGTCGGATVPNDGYALLIQPYSYSTMSLYRLDSGAKTTLASLANGAIDPNGKWLKLTYYTPNINVYSSTDNLSWTSQMSSASAPSKTAGPLFLAEYSCGDRGGSIVYDYLFVKNYISPEPAWSSPIGAEEWLNSFFNAGD